MTAPNKHQILLLGLDNRLLWQLTRILSLMEDQIEFHCIQDYSEAETACGQGQIDLIVVDEWEGALQAIKHLGGEDIFQKGSWKWIVLADTIPPECLPNGNIPSSVIFLEKPFNPKEIPSFFLEILEEREQQEVSTPPPSFTNTSLPLTQGEKYCPPDTLPISENTEGKEPLSSREQIGNEAGSTKNSEFYCLQDMGFACLKVKDWEGAKKHWNKALEIRPFDQRLQLNLKRLSVIIQPTHP